MRIIEAADYDDMSQKAAGRIINKVSKSEQIVLGLATGGTPEATYEELVKDHQKQRTSYRHVSTVNLDEYVGLPADNKNSYHAYMKTHFFNHIDIPKDQYHLPNGMARDVQEECERYDDLIRSLGGIDLQLLGIGINGHIGFNEPETPFTSTTHVVKIAESTREANARYFNHIDEVPTHAITMGIQTILQSREIILLASGQHKAEAVAQLINGGIQTGFPASVLKNHRDVTVIADREALSGVTLREERAID